MISEEEGCCLEQWCLYIHRLKSGFSRVDWPRSGPVRSGPIFGDRSNSPDRTVWAIETAVRTEKYGPV